MRAHLHPPFLDLPTEILGRYEKGAKLSGIIYTHRISDNRFGGIAVRNFGMFRKLCGESALKNVVLATNMWQGISPDVGEARENELSSRFFKAALDKGAQMVRHHDTRKSAHDIIRKIMTNHPVVLRIQQELVDEGINIVDTEAGEAVNQELHNQAKRHHAELEKVHEEMMQALKEKDEETKQELQEEAKRLQEELEKIVKHSEGMDANYAAEKEKMEVWMREIAVEILNQVKQHAWPERGGLDDWAGMRIPIPMVRKDPSANGAEQEAKEGQLPGADQARQEDGVDKPATIVVAFLLI